MTEGSNNTDAPLVEQAAGYWAESRTPLTSLVFIAPLLLCYEVGAVVLKVQNGADVWLRRWLDMLGFGQHFLLPLLTVGVLLGWQYVTRRPWRVSPRVLATMAVECILAAILLWLISRMLGTVWRSVEGWFETRTAAAPALSIGQRLQIMVGCCGAGIYEEVLFRMLLLSAAVWLAARSPLSPRWGLTLAVVVTSLLFAAAHYVGQYGEDFEAFSFTFRFVAGVFFSVLFVCRGFGIAAGTHAAYDVFVALILARR